MKATFRRMCAFAAVMAIFPLTATSTLAAPQNPASQPPRAQVTAPKVVSTPSTLSAHELAKYQEKSAQSRQAANDNAAGASSNKTVWIVVGVAVAAGLIALAAGGGGGGGY